MGGVGCPREIQRRGGGCPRNQVPERETALRTGRITDSAEARLTGACTVPLEPHAPPVTGLHLPGTAFSSRSFRELQC